MRKMRRVLVTGATGFIGSHLAKTLTGMHIDTTGMARNPEKAATLTTSGVQIIRGDVTEIDSLREAVKGIDTVFHAASVLGPASLDDEVYRKINAGGTANLIRACRENGRIERFVHVSSVGVLGPVGPKETACEGTPPNPKDIYEITKLEGEEIALQAAEEGFPAVIARPAWVYGPADTRTLKLFKMIAHRKLVIVGKAQNRQHPVHVSDLVNGLIRCAQIENIEGKVYHLAGPDIIRVQKLCRLIADAADVKLPSFTLPLWTVLVPALAVEKLFSLWGGDPPIDHRKVDFFRIHRAYSIRRAEKELEWKPSIPFKDGIQQTIKWYRENGILPSN
jgi:nucleoside-diphosphate-sugar epimerase